MNELFEKLINNTISKTEYEQLMAYINKPDTAVAVKEMLAKHWKNVKQYDEKNTDSERSFQLLFKEIEQRDAISKIKHLKSFHSRRRFQIAAVILVIIGTFLLNRFSNSEIDEIDKKGTIIPNGITLTYEDGRVDTLLEEGSQKIKSANGRIVGAKKGNRLEYIGQPAQKELVYNELKVPFGKRFNLVLSDGSKVTLNAGSSIKFPVQFIPHKSRVISLSGEAFFEVVKDTKHPFVVKVGELNVQVLGTQFNVSHYPEDTIANTVLVEGAVGLYKAGTDLSVTASTKIQPGQKAAWNANEHNIEISEVDVHQYIAWKDGVLLFKGMPFHSIQKKLERHFNVVIDNQYQLMENQIYTVTFRNENITEIMEAFKLDIPFEYTIDDNKIIITEPKK